MNTTTQQNEQREQRPLIERERRSQARPKPALDWSERQKLDWSDEPKQQNPNHQPDQPK